MYLVRHCVVDVVSGVILLEYFEYFELMAACSTF